MTLGVDIKVIDNTEAFYKKINKRIILDIP